MKRNIFIVITVLLCFILQSTVFRWLAFGGIRTESACDHHSNFRIHVRTEMRSLGRLFFRPVI